MFSFTFRVEHAHIFTGFRIQPSWAFPIASKFITVSYALSIHIPECNNQDTDNIASSAH